MADPDIGEATAATYEDVYPDKPTDNFFNSMALWFALGEKGFKKSVNGGRLFEWPIEYAENTTQQMVGEFDPLDTTIIPVFDAARYDIKIAAGTVAYSYKEMLTNQGSPRAKFDLIASRIENGRKSHRNLLNTQAWNTSTPGSLELTSIPTIIAITPTSGTVGGINSATFTFWRNRSNTAALTATAFDNLISKMELTFNQCSLGGFEMTPSCFVTGVEVFSGYESVTATRLRYITEDLKKNNDPAFLANAIKFKAIPFFYDEQLSGRGTGYFLNNEILKFEYLEGGWMKLDPAVDPANQLLNVHKLYTMGNFTCGARRHLGVVSSIT